ASLEQRLAADEAVQAPPLADERDDRRVLQPFPNLLRCDRNARIPLQLGEGRGRVEHVGVDDAVDQVERVGGGRRADDGGHYRASTRIGKLAVCGLGSSGSSSL